jgi:hypothetical protein
VAKDVSIRGQRNDRPSNDRDFALQCHPRTVPELERKGLEKWSSPTCYHRVRPFGAGIRTVARTTTNARFSGRSPSPAGLPYEGIRPRASTSAEVGRWKALAGPASPPAVGAQSHAPPGGTLLWRPGGRLGVDA